jgi:CRISPR-associated protein Csx3
VRVGPLCIAVHLDRQLEALAPGVDEWTPDLLEPLLAGLPTQAALSVYGYGPNWLYGTLALHARTQPFYQFDPCLGWVQPPLLRSEPDIPGQATHSIIQITLEPGVDRSTIIIHPIHIYLDYTEAAQLAFPELVPGNGVIVSGPLLPLWLFTALARFYAERMFPGSRCTMLPAIGPSLSTRE